MAKSQSFLITIIFISTSYNVKDEISDYYLQKKGGGGKMNIEQERNINGDILDQNLETKSNRDHGCGGLQINYKVGKSIN